MKADFDIGNLVYIILIVVVVITSAFGKKKKPVQKVQSAVEPDVPGNPFTVEDALTRKLKEFLGEYNQPAPVAATEPEIEEELYGEEKLDVPVSTETVYASANVISPETLLDDYKSPFDNSEFMLDSIGKEEGIPNWNYEEEVHIKDEIKLSEGKEMVAVDYNPEMEELIANFDARQAFIYSEVFNRKQF